MIIKKQSLIGYSGVVWGLSSFTFELVPADAVILQLALRSFFVFIASIIIIGTLPANIKRRYLLGMSLFLMYFSAYLVTNIIHGVVVADLFREILLILVVGVLSILLSNKEYVGDFLKGMYIAMNLFILYCLFSIDFFQIFTSFYRLSIGLGPNGIGAIGVMVFILSSFYLFSEKHSDEKYLFVLMAVIACTVVIATKSRSSLIMLVLAFILINVYFSNRKLLIGSALILFFIVGWNFEVVESVFRTKLAEDYSGEKNIYNLTGRTEIWGHALMVIADNLFIGVGSNDAYVMVDGHKGSYHNAFIQLFVTVGLLGFIPIALIIFLAIRSVMFARKMFLFKAIFIVGMVGAMAESRMFNFGSPANLLFLLSILYLIDVEKNYKEKY